MTPDQLKQRLMDAHEAERQKTMGYRFVEALIDILCEQRQALAYVSMSVPNNFIAGAPRDTVIEQLEFANSTIVGDAERANKALAATDEALKRMGVE